MPQLREPRLPRARAVAPPLDVVAEAAVKLARADPGNALVAYARSRPEVADRLLRREALVFHGMDAGVLSVTARDQLTAARFQRGERTIRRWRTGH